MSAAATLLLGATPAPRPGVDLAALRDKEERVLTVGHRLATSAAALCRERRPSIGVALHELSQYAPAYRTAAAATIARPDLPAVLAVAADGPAARADVRAGDAIVAVAGEPVPSAGIGGLARVEAVLGGIERAGATGPVELTLARDGRSLVRRVAATPICSARFQVRVDPELNAWADGWLIEVSTGLVDFARGPDELAAALAHELAHNILRHRERLRDAGRSARFTRAAELEADRLSVRLVRDAGYATAGATRFWVRMRDQGGAGPSGAGTHPSDRERIAAIEAERRRLGEPGVETAGAAR